MGVIENRIDITELERSGGGGGGGTAASVSYDNTSSGLAATTVQGAIDEVVDESAGKDQISNRNLLDNPFFTVNQRGKTTYNAAGYTVDRWMIAADQDITVSNNGITTGTTAQFHQRIEPTLYTGLIGKTVTASVLLSDGTILKASGLVAAENGTYVTIDTSDLNVVLIKDASNFFFMVTFKTTTVTVKAVKLEIGSVSTLDMDTAPNYAEELLKCQRYFVRIGGQTGNSFEPFGSGFIKNANRAYIYTKLPTEMRSLPTITLTGKLYVQTPSLGSTDAPSTVENVSARGLNALMLYLKPDTTDQFTAGNAAVGQFNNSQSGTPGSYLDLTSDL